MRIEMYSVHNDCPYTFVYEDTDSYLHLPTEACRYICGICFHEGKILPLSENQTNKFSVPGCHLVGKETLEDKLGTVLGGYEIVYSHPIGYQKVIDVAGEAHYELQSMCIVRPEGKAGAIVHNMKLVTPEQFLDIMEWGEIGKRIMERGTALYKAYISHPTYGIYI